MWREFVVVEIWKNCLYAPSPLKIVINIVRLKSSSSVSFFIFFLLVKNHLFENRVYFVNSHCQ